MSLWCAAATGLVFELVPLLPLDSRFARVCPALLATLVFRFTGLAPDNYAVTERQLTAFISHPDGLGAVVAVLAGIVGMLSLTEAGSGSLIGVLVSVTTIPAAANVGVATAYGEWNEVSGRHASARDQCHSLDRFGSSDTDRANPCGHDTAPAKAR